MQVNRSYAHRDHGQIGAVELEAPKGTWKLDGHGLPESSVEHLLTFALQTLQDAYAGASDAKDAKERWESKRAKLLDGTIGVRTGGGVSALVAECRKIARAALRAQKGKDVAKDATDEQLDAIVDANRDAIEAAAQAAIAKREKERLETAKFAKAVVIEV